MTVSVEWFTLPEAAALALPGMPATATGVKAVSESERWQRPEWVGQRWRRRAGRGGGVEYHWSLLPPEARLRWAVLHSVSDVAVEHSQAQSAPNYNALLWDHFNRLSASKKGKAFRRQRALLQLDSLVTSSGRSRGHAVLEVAASYQVSANALRSWEKLVCGQPRSSWLPLLAPQHKGRVSRSEYSEEAWEAIYKEYARQSRPAFSYCYRKIIGVAKKNGWIVPSEDTLLRRMQQVDPHQLALARGGDAALKRMMPAQKRDKTIYHALEAVNADGHKFDIPVDWGDGDIKTRPMVVCFQDLYSGKFLSWRIDKTENTNLIRLAFGDVVERYGIPSHCYLDNGRAFASKQMTGGTAHRFRGRIKEEDTDGIMVRLGTTVHFTSPFSGQSKPIERGFGDFARDIAKDIRLEGTYLGNSPRNKPANCGQRAPVSLAEFEKILAEGINEHNARPGRRSQVCASKYSFNEVFERSYAGAAITKIAPAQRQLWLPSIDNILVRGPDGHIEFSKNDYAASFLVALIGKRVSIRFDPDALHEPLHIYRGDGSYLGAAPCTVAVGFNSTEGARNQSKLKADIRRRARELHAAGQRLSLEEHLRLTAHGEVFEPAPEAKVIRPIFRSGGALAYQPEPEPDEVQSEFEKEFVRGAAARRAARGQGSL